MMAFASIQVCFERKMNEKKPQLPNKINMCTTLLIQTNSLKFVMILFVNSRLRVEFENVLVDI